MKAMGQYKNVFVYIRDCTVVFMSTEGTTRGEASEMQGEGTRLARSKNRSHWVISL